MPSGLGGPRVDQLDGWRAVLATAVIVHHLVWQLGDASPLFIAGWLGVEGFFVLSGYLITRNLLAELDRRGTIDYPRFIARRLARLYPALLVALGGIALLALLVDRFPWSDTWPSLVSAGSYTQNLAYLDGSNWFGFHGFLDTIGPLWSLSIEFQFYVAVPLLLLALTVLRVPRALWLVLAVAGAAVAAAVRADLGFAEYPLTYLFTPLRIDSLLLGVALAIARNLGLVQRIPGAVVRLLGVAGLVALGWIYVSLSVFDDATYVWGIAAGGLASTAVLLWLLLDPAGPAARLLATRPLAALGRWSYGAYIWHQPVLRLLEVHLGLDRLVTLAPAAFGLTWAIAALSYRCVERPAIARSDALWRRRSGDTAMTGGAEEPTGAAQDLGGLLSRR